MSIRHAILALLKQKPRHGYELHQTLEALMGGRELWDIKPAQIHATLTRLEQQGWVKGMAGGRRGGPERRIYHLTSKGEQALDAWFAQGVVDQHLRDAFFLKFMVALTLNEELARQLVRTQRAALYRELHRIMALRQRITPYTDLAHTLLLDKASMHLEADLHWLDMIESRLDEIVAQPIPVPKPRKRGRPRKQTSPEDACNASSQFRTSKG